MKTSPILLAAVALLPFVGTAFANNSTWTTNGNGTFSDPLNWSDGVPGATTGNASTDVATFNRSTFTSAGVVTLDTGYNIAGITFNSTGTGNNITVGNSTINRFTFSAGSLVQSIGNAAGTYAITSNINLAGNLTFSNTNSSASGILQFGANAAARSMNADASLGNVFVTFTGNNTNTSNLAYATYNQGNGTTLGIIKDGAGSWQLNNIGGNMTGGFLVKNGTFGFGQSAAASLGTITLGSAETTSGNLILAGGSSVAIGGAIVVASSNATNVILQRTGGSGATTYSGNISLARDLVVRHGAASNQALNISGNVTGTGNLAVTSTLASTSNITFSQSINMAGSITNNSTAGTGFVVFSGAIGSNVLGLTQNSASVNMTLSNAGNAYGTTAVTAGTLLVSGSGKLGTGDVSVAGGATLSLGNNATINDSADLLFQNLAAISLSFTGIDTVGAIGNTSTNSFIAIGTYDATQLNTFFGGSVFSGTGSLQVTAVPEPTTWALIGLGLGATLLFRRRKG